MTIVRKVRWVQTGYGSVNQADHVDGESAGEFTPPPSPDPDDPAPTPIPLIWRWREYDFMSGDPTPDRTHYGPSAVFGWGGASRQPVRRTFSVDVPQGQYETRFRRNSPDETDEKATSDVFIGQVKSIQPDTGDYYGRTLMAMRIRATGQLNGVVQNVSGRVFQDDSFIKAAGGGYQSAHSSNPARVLYRWLRGGFDQYGRRLWGAGLPDSRIDVEGIDAWGYFCGDNNLAVDFVIDSSSMSVDDVVNLICRCGRASKSFATGKVGVVWDAPGLPVTATFTPTNIKQGSFTIDYISGDLPDAIVLRYLDRTTWKPNSVVVKALGVDTPQRPQDVELAGCTYTELAGREANLMMAQQLYRTRHISWETDAEGLSVRKGDVVSLSHNLMDWGDSGRLMAGAGTSVTLDRPVQGSGLQQYLSLVDHEGNYSVRGVAVFSDVRTVLTLNEAIVGDVHDSDPDAGIPIDWRWQFDATPTPGWKVKIVAIEPAPGYEGVKLIACDEVAAYYDAENGPFERVGYRGGSRLPVLTGLHIGEELIRAGDGFAVRLSIVWFASGEVATAVMRYQIDGGVLVQNGNVQGNRAELIVPFGARQVLVKITGYNGIGQSGPSAQVSGMHVIGRFLTPDITGLLQYYDGNATAVAWDAIRDVRGVLYEVRRGDSWGTAIVVAQTPLTHFTAGANGTYWIAGLVNDVYSRNPVSIVVEGAIISSNVIATWDEKDTGWTGDLTDGAAIIDDTVRLVGDSLFSTIPLLSAVPRSIVYFGTSAPFGEYFIPEAHEVDIGHAQRCNVSVSYHAFGATPYAFISDVPLISGLASFVGDTVGTYDVVISIAIAQDDEIYGDWQRFISGAYVGRKFKFKVSLSSSEPTVVAILDEFAFSVDVPDRVEKGTGVECPNTGLAVVFSRPFQITPNTQITIVDAMAGDHVRLTGESPDGFSVEVVNAGVVVTRNINWLSQAY
jgi:hypothetical protein